MFRSGESLAVRLPRRQLGAELIEKEQTWLPRLAPKLTLPVPQPVRVGVPAGHYPWRWSVVPWMIGKTVEKEILAAGEGQRFANFLRSLHTPATEDAPRNLYRDIPLIQCSNRIQACISKLEGTTDAIERSIKKLWKQACAAPITTPPTLIHGDLHARNVLAHMGKITSVIDWGDLTAGDVATDLAAIWMLFEQPSERESVIATYQLDEATYLRAQGWAIFFATILLKTGRVDNLSQAKIARATLQRLIEDHR